MRDLPAWAETEHAFAEWAEARGLDETNEAWVLYAAWTEGDY